MSSNAVYPSSLLSSVEIALFVYLLLDSRSRGVQELHVPSHSLTALLKEPGKTLYFLIEESNIFIDSDWVDFQQEIL